MIITKYNTGKPLIQKSILEYDISLLDYTRYNNGRELCMLYKSYKEKPIIYSSRNKKAIDHAFFNYIMCKYNKSKPLSSY